MKWFWWVRFGNAKRWAFGFAVHPLDWGIRVGLFDDVLGLIHEGGVQVGPVRFLIGWTSEKIWRNVRTQDYVETAVRARARRDRAKRKRVRRGGHS